jgi:hypothetical protein
LFQPLLDLFIKNAKVETDFFSSSRPELPDFSRYNIPKRGKCIPNDHKMYQMDKHCAQHPYNIPTFPFQGPRKYTQIGFFGIKICYISGNPDLGCKKEVTSEVEHTKLVASKFSAKE